MTTEVQDYKCPMCGHTLGEIEYFHACERIQKQKEEEIEQMRFQSAQQLKGKEEEFKRNIESIVTSRMNRERQNYNQELIEEKNRHAQDVKSLKSQVQNLADEKLRLAMTGLDTKYRQSEEQYKLQISRLDQFNKKLQIQVEEQAKRLQQIPGERQGTAGENVLLEDLRLEFSRDEFICKKNGVAMADIVQYVVTENGNRIETPIVYDKKTSSKLTKMDIDKAKNYKEKHKTDHCIIVTVDIKETVPPRFTEMRDGILLVHPTVVVDIANRIRSYLMEASRIQKLNGNGDSAKQRLYEFLTSSEYNRDRQARLDAKLKLDELHRSELKIWSKREECIRKWYELDSKLDAFISHITQEDDNEDD